MSRLGFILEMLGGFKPDAYVASDDQDGASSWIGLKSRQVQVWMVREAELCRHGERGDVLEAPNGHSRWVRVISVAKTVERREMTEKMAGKRSVYPLSRFEYGEKDVLHL